MWGGGDGGWPPSPSKPSSSYYKQRYIQKMAKC